MKKRKIICCFVVLLGILFIPFFAGCDFNDKVSIKLKAPDTVSYKINQSSGRQILFVEENPMASGYLFGVSETNTTDLDAFLKYEITEVGVNGKIKNYLDVTNLFLNSKTYYFYAQYLGDNKYEDSNISSIEQVSIYHKYDSPFLSLNGTTLSWSGVQNADSYSVYANYEGKKEVVFNTSGTSYDITTFINQKIRLGLSSSVKFTVCVDAYQNNLRSAESNEVTYKAFLELPVPTNLHLEEIEDHVYLLWDENIHCSSYTILLNLVDEIVVDSNNCVHISSQIGYDLTAYLEELGEYEIFIKSNDTNNYIGSEYSDAIFYTHTEQLATPQNVKIMNYVNSVEIYWDAVENANEYILFFSDTSDNFKLKQFFVNGVDGVESPIIHNSILLTYEQMGISSYEELKNNRFLIQIQAKGYGYYLSSENSVEHEVLDFDEDIDSPQIVDNSATQTLSWDAVSNATKYIITIVHNNQIDVYETTLTEFNYTDYILEADQYSIKCSAVSRDGKTSPYSNAIEKVTYRQLQIPTINQITVEDSKFVIDFSQVQNAETYTLYVYNEILSDVFSSTENTIQISSAIDFEQDEILKFRMVANGNGYYTKSEKSDFYEFCVKLSTPAITLQNNSLSWTNIENATSYNLVLDDVILDLSDISTNVDLIAYVLQNTTRQVRIQATNPFLHNSDFSNMKYFNRSPIMDGYSNTYFYYGQTYDYYIISEQEFKDAYEYTFFNRIDKLKIYVDYDHDVTISDKVEIVKQVLTGTRSYSLSYTYTKNYGGAVEISFNYKAIGGPQNYESDYEQDENGMIYQVESTRDENYVFASDNYIVSQQVRTTDGLLSAIQHKARPEFSGTSTVPLQVYNAAKNLLIQIVDDTMTDYEKALAIHDYLVENVAYDFEGFYNSNSSVLEYCHYIESSLFKNLSVCDGYSKTFALLCGMEGIECILVDGETEAGGHTWNKIFLDLDGNGSKECYVVDCTHDDYHVWYQNTFSGEEIKREYLTHAYFLVPDSYVADRTESAVYPSAVTSEKFYSYYRPYGFSLKIDNPTASQALRSFLNTHIVQSYKLELLVSNSYMNFGGHSYTTVTYKPNSDYKIVYIYQ